MQMPGRKYSAAATYRYGFNGKENDNEVKGEGNQQDYGMRIYDPRVCRFLSVDPLTPEYPWYTPYQFAGNSPISNIDRDGLEDSLSTGAKSNYIIPLAPVANETVRQLAQKTIEEAAKRGGSELAKKAAQSWLARIAAGGSTVALTVIGVFLPLEAGRGSSRDFSKPNPLGYPVTQPLPTNSPAPVNQKESPNNKLFYVTYTKSKLNSDGTIITYSGRSSGVYAGDAPTEAEARQVVQNRENGHLILKQEHYSPAILDEYSTSRSAIRGREQQLIDYNGGAQSEGGSSRNKIRGVSRNNPAKHIYRAAATVSFGPLPSNNPTDKK